MFLLTATKKGFSSNEIQRQLGLKCYEPVWAMVHKLRKAMGNNYTGIKVGSVFGWGYSLVYTGSYTFFEYNLPKSELYNRIIFGKGSTTYRYREHYWYRSAFE